MLPTFLVAALALGSSVLAAPSNYNSTINTAIPRACGTSLTPEQITAAEAHFAQHKVSPKTSATQAATISVYFHVVYKSTGD